MISLKNCTVAYGEEILFQPEWGNYDMAIGKKVVSAFAGPADPYSFDLITHTPSSTTIKSKKTPEKQELEDLYQSVRNIRNGDNSRFSLEGVFEILKGSHPKDWLLPVEIYELVIDREPDFASEVKEHLMKIKNERPKIAHLIDGGIELVESSLVTDH